MYAVILLCVEPASSLTRPITIKGPGERVTHPSLLPPSAALLLTPDLTSPDSGPDHPSANTAPITLHHNILSACYTSYIYICIHYFLSLTVVLWIVRCSVASGASKAVKTDRMLSIFPINLQCQQSKVENSNEKMEALRA